MNPAQAGMNAENPTALRNHKFRDAARADMKKRFSSTDEFTVTEDCKVLTEDGGCWVAAWVWVEGKVCKDCGMIFTEDCEEIEQCTDCRYDEADNLVDD